MTFHVLAFVVVVVVDLPVSIRAGRRRAGLPPLEVARPHRADVPRTLPAAILPAGVTRSTVTVSTSTAGQVEHHRDTVTELGPALAPASATVAEEPRAFRFVVPRQVIGASWIRLVVMTLTISGSAWWSVTVNYALTSTWPLNRPRPFPCRWCRS